MVAAGGEANKNNMKTEKAMAEKFWPDRIVLKPVSETSTSTELNVPEKEGPPAGWRRFGGRRRGSLDFLFHSHHLSQPDQQKPPERKTSLTPEMEVPSNLNVRRNSSDSMDSGSPGTSPTSRGSILDGFMKAGVVSIKEVEEDYSPDFAGPMNRPRTNSMSEAMQWLFKPMDQPKQLKPRDLNAFVPTST